MQHADTCTHSTIQHWSGSVRARAGPQILERLPAAYYNMCQNTFTRLGGVQWNSKCTPTHTTTNCKEILMGAIGTYLYNIVFAHSTVTNDDDRRQPCVTIKGLEEINTNSELINT